ncbi:MAG: UbiX family flavin prenyltransferase [Proteobacteria bacterium]|nr:UbiX family flavin prenyltransferase [Pseudomonadota bacterium]MBU4011022.1 UbiX family flavin prenyltransferase [Pseudomonadota bacterium]MBU4036448.1 UbiX family flavin prenyltransferase [Pseudomonadota bacterium]
MRNYMKKRLVIGISGATGAVYGIRMLEMLKDSDVETHLVLSNAAEKIIQLETDYTIDHVKGLAHYNHDIDNVGAAIASGSFDTIGMVVIPCSIKTLSGIANSFSVNLLIRAADVTLKERRKLVLMVGETPFHKGHFRLMSQAADIGAIITLPSVSFYTKPETIKDIVDQRVARTLNLFDIKLDSFKRWSQADGDKAMDLLKKERGL